MRSRTWRVEASSTPSKSTAKMIAHLPLLRRTSAFTQSSSFNPVLGSSSMPVRSMPTAGGDVNCSRSGLVGGSRSSVEGEATLDSCIFASPP